jgi:uncharacterized protein (DUF1778 family)
MLMPKLQPEYQEMLDYYEEKRRTGTEMEGLVPVSARVAKNPGAIFSVRFNMGELGVVEQAAEAKGMKLGAFIREAALNAALDRTAVASEGKVDLTLSQQEMLFQALRQVISTAPETKPSRRARRSSTAAQEA